MASTSAVYGARSDYPFRETDNCDYPLTLYSASKKAVENIAHCYAHVWGVPITIARFFSAYGPWGRPDMAMFKFVENILLDRPIDIYNHGNMQRDWTYIDDLVEAVVLLTEVVPTVGESASGVRDTLSQVAPFRVVNIGGGRPMSLIRFIEEVEGAVGKVALRNYLGMQLGDVERSEASTELLEALTGFRPSTPISKGVNSFVDWYRDYYRV
jgi:UDP-glucuronate 4-epimerase